MSPEEFLTEIWETYTFGGMTMPLPDAWRLRVSYIPASADDWEFAVRKAFQATSRSWRPIDQEAVFNYAVGILWQRLGQTSEIDARPLRPYVVDPAAEMQAAADALAAEIAEQERREAQVAQRARALAVKRERTDVIMQRAGQVALVRNPNTSKIHRASGCSGPLSRHLEPYEIQPEDTPEDLCRYCLPTKWRDMDDEQWMKWISGGSIA